MNKSYAEKRNFQVTSEPEGGPAHAAPSGGLTFVVQKHAASHLHYDFRLELHGALVSWAVPKGPSLNPHEKRLAAKVEDHPLEYGGFEGTIPQGEYGGGEVIVWDRGTYESQKSAGSREEQERELEAELERGKLEFVLHGEKLGGAWVLVHTKGNQWLLMKRQDEFATDQDVLGEDRSVLTGHRIGGVLDLNHAPERAAEASKNIGPEPMLLTEVEHPFSSPEWLFELKLDGIRAICRIEGGVVRLISRNGNDVTDRFPVLLGQLQSIGLSSASLDGEIVQFDAAGKPDFQALVQPFKSGKVTQATYFLFDLLELEGRSLLEEPLSVRKGELERLKLDTPLVRRLDTFPEDGKLLYEHATRQDLEGIVGKRLDSTYQPGVRSRDWVKIKRYHSEEFVVVGWTKGERARSSTFGALVLAQTVDGSLVYQGNVGGGFTDRDLEEIAKTLRESTIEKSPLPFDKSLKDVTWVQPKLVAEVRFMTRTKDGRLRFPIFQRLRPDLGSIPMPAPPHQQPADHLLQIIRDLENGPDDMQLESGRFKIHFSHLGKELWPGVTKRALAIYYATASETLLKYLVNRPLSFVRCPDGVGGERFFQKHWDKGRPEFVETVSIFSSANEGPRDFVMCNNLESLLWLAQMGAVELNPWNSKVVRPDAGPVDLRQFEESKSTLEGSILNRPDYLVLDLDPFFGGKASEWKRPEWDRLVEVALTLRELLESGGLRCFPKSSGKSGLHLYLPVAPEYTYDEIRAAAMAIGEQAIRILGKKITLEWNIKKRTEGVFIDVNQNVRGKTMAAPYSPRAALHPGVSMPLLWDELERIDPSQFTVTNAAARLAQKGDLWLDTLGLHQRLMGPAPTP